MLASELIVSQTWWYMPLIPATLELRKENYILRACLGSLVKSCLNLTQKSERGVRGMAQ